MSPGCRTFHEFGPRLFIHSLVGRLILIFSAVGMLLLALFAVAVAFALNKHYEDTIRPHLQNYFEYVQADIGTPHNQIKAMELGRRLNISIQIDGPGSHWASDGHPIDLAACTLCQRRVQGGLEFSLVRYNDREYLLTKHGEYTYTYSLIPEKHSLILFVTPPLLLLLILGLLYYATRRLFAPIGTIQEGIERIGHGDLDYRIQVKRSDELGDLGRAINVMAEDVQQMLDSKRQLLLAISHELRSPLTRAKVASSLLDDEGQRADIDRELNELETLVEELLETERLASRHHALYQQQVNLNSLCQDAIKALRVQRLPKLHLPPNPVVAELDQIRIKLLLKNLLENALQHTPLTQPAPELKLAVRYGDEYVKKIPMQQTQISQGVIEISILDYGLGIPPEHLPYVTEPFYRCDPARRRETGGYGLGLYLCRRIAEVHGGILEISRTENGGTQVCAFLPMKALPALHSKSSVEQRD